MFSRDEADITMISYVIEAGNVGKAVIHIQCLSQELKKVRHMSHQAEKGETYVSPS